jgi:hypothetical protein
MRIAPVIILTLLIIKKKILAPVKDGRYPLRFSIELRASSEGVNQPEENNGS